MKEYAHRLPEGRSAEIYMRLLQILVVEKQYLDPSLTATKLAERMEVDKRVVSAVIVRETGENYTHLVNKLRLDEACKMLKSPRYSELTAEQIGLMCGFKNRQSFYTAFDGKMGMTPRQYRNKK